MTEMTLELTTINIGSPDPARLARFYERLLGWTIGHEEPGFVIVRNPAGGVAISCQQEDGHVRPVWPARPGDQQMQLHLEIRVPELVESLAHALDCGATLADVQPQDDVRVCVDPTATRSASGAAEAELVSACGSRAPRIRRARR